MADTAAAGVIPYYADDLVTIYHGDCRELLPSIGPVPALFADPPYGVGKAPWDDIAPMEWLPLINADVAAITPGNANLARYPERIGDLAYRWTLAAHITNALVRGATGFGNWIACLLYARESVSIYSQRPDIRDFAIRGDMPDHPSPKPVGVMLWIVSMIPGGLILDPFMGSGTTLVAAKALNRHAIGIDVDERSCEQAARRCSQEVLGLVG
jgi:DNA modification methylase